MKCKNCGEKLKENEELSKDKKVYKIFLVGTDPENAREFCEDCAGKRTAKRK